eukprot:7385825-Prymnesium_polylepis.1
MTASATTATCPRVSMTPGRAAARCKRSSCPAVVRRRTSRCATVSGLILPMAPFSAICIIRSDPTNGEASCASTCGTL